MRILRQNLGLKVLALVLAVLAWSIVRVVGSPTGETPAQRVFTKPITVTPPERSGLVSQIVQKEVTVTLRGKRTVLDRIAPGQISADVDLSRRVPGYFMETVNVLAPGGAEVAEVEPSHVWVQVSRRQSAQVPVKVEVLGQAPEGYRVDKPLVDPRVVRVAGPQDEVEKVVAVHAPVNLAGAARTFSTRARTLEAVDAAGLEVAGVEVESEGVDVTLPITLEPRDHQARVDTRRITVRGSNGWTYTTRVDPEEVTLVGPPQAQPPEAIETEPMTFGHSAQPQTREVRLKAPRGFQVVGDATVRVTVIPTRTSGGPASDSTEKGMEANAG